MLTPSTIKKSLESCISNMAIERERFIKNPSKDFTRNTKCNLDNTVRIILGFEDQCLGSELKTYFSSKKLYKLPYKSTFVQQRNKLKDEAFENLFFDFNAKHPFKRKKYGLHILACDGTDINLPTLFSDKKYFVEKNIKNGEGFYQMHCNALQDLCEQRFKDVVLQPRAEFNEGQALCTMVDRAEYEPYSALYIADRGYFSWNLAAHIINASQYFLIRARGLCSSRSAFKGMNIPEHGEFDVWQNIKIIRSGKKNYKDNPGEYKCITNKRVFDFIDMDDHTSTFEISFRVVSVLLSNGTYEYLLTNLPEKIFPPAKLKYLYSLRWNEETAFRHLKFNCGLYWFHSVKRNFIIQEVYAKLLMYNYTSLLAQTVKVTNKSSNKHKHKLSFSNAIKIARLFLKMPITNKLIKTLLLMDSPPIRNNRSAPRNVRCRRAIPLNNRV